MCTFLGSDACTTTAYHPQHNGMVERFHRTLKAALMAKLKDRADWYDLLPAVLLALRVQDKQNLGMSAAEAVYGDTLRIPGEFTSASASPSTTGPAFVQRLRDHFRQVQPPPPKWHGGESRGEPIPGL